MISCFDPEPKDEATADLDLGLEKQRAYTKIVNLLLSDCQLVDNWQRVEKKRNSNCPTLHCTKSSDLSVVAENVRIHV